MYVFLFVMLIFLVLGIIELRKINKDIKNSNKK